MFLINNGHAFPNAKLHCVIARDGIITTEELSTAIKKLHSFPNEDKCRRISELLDEDKDGNVDLDSLHRVGAALLNILQCSACSFFQNHIFFRAQIFDFSQSQKAVSRVHFYNFDGRYLRVP